MNDTYTPAADRYADETFHRRCGKSGLKLPAISLGCWHNFGDQADQANCKELLFGSFDLGITHFDLANNYGPAPGSAETNVGKIIKHMPRHELIISTKAGFSMWPGPYGDGGSRKYLIASLDQSLKRLGLDYVDIFYHHRPDAETPLEETLGALDIAVKQGKALYAGISNYNGELAGEAVRVCERAHLAHLLINQISYSMLNRWCEHDALPQAGASGLGVIAFCPLSQGLLTDKYLEGIPQDSRAAGPSIFLKPESVSPDVVKKIHALNNHAKRRGQTLAQMALAWILKDHRVTSALIGASRLDQVRDNVKAAQNTTFTEIEIETLDSILGV